MRRRKVIALVGQATAAPFIGSGSLHAQMPERMRHIGVLKYTGESDQTSKAGAQAFETPPSPPQNSPSTSTVSTVGRGTGRSRGAFLYAKCLAQSWLGEARIKRPMIEVKRSAGSGFRRSSVDPLMKQTARGRRPHPRRATARRPLLSGIISLVPTGPAVHRAGVRTPRTHR